MLRDLLLEICRDDPLPGRITAEIRPEEFLFACYEHRIEGRVLARRDELAGAGLDVGLLREIESVYSRIVEDADEKLRTWCSVDGHFPVASKPIVLKSPAPWLLTNGHVPIRRSSDLDVLPSDQEEFSRIVQGQGFSRLPYTPAPHETGKWSNGSIFIDVHRCVQVRGIRPPYRNGVQQFEFSKSVQREVEWNLLQCDAVRRTTSHGELSIPSIEASLVVMCSHIYRDYVGTWWPIKYGTVRLGELADVRDMLNLHDFDHLRFHELIREWNAAESVSFVSYLLQSLLGCSSLLLAGYDIPRFGRQLWWDENLPAQLSFSEPFEDPKELVERGAPFEDHLALVSGENGPERLDPRVEIAEPAEAVPSLRFVSGGQQVSVKVGAERRGSHLVLRVVSCCDPAESADHDIAVFNFGDMIIECDHAGMTEDVAVFDHMLGGRYGGEMPGEIEVEARGYGRGLEVAVAVPLEMLGGQGPVSAVVAIGRISDSPSGRRGLVFVPVVVDT